MTLCRRHQWRVLLALTWLGAALPLKAAALDGAASLAGVQGPALPVAVPPGRPTAPAGAAPAQSASAAQATLQPAKIVTVQAMGPSSLTQFVANRVIINLNGSLCSNLAQGGGGEANATARLHLVGARLDGKDAVFPGSATANCTHLVFSVTPDASVRSGAFAARISAPGGAPLQLPGAITVVRPPTVGVAARSIELAADGTAAQLRVRLSASAKVAVRVRLQLSDGALQLVGGDRVTWPPGQSGERTFTLRVTSAPRAGRISARLVDAEGGAVIPAADAEASVVVLSPVLSFVPTKQAIVRGDAAPPLVTFKLSGTSAFPSSWSYTTYLLNGSRPTDAGSCRAGANASAAPGAAAPPGCAADWDARANLSVRGTVWVQPGQASVAPVRLPLEWERVPYEAEYMVGVRISPLINGRATQQATEAAAVVFGTPPGHCPPGSALRRDAARAGDAADGPMYGGTAALQELRLWVDGLGGANSSSIGGGGGGGALGAAGGGSNGSALDLDPPFQPLTDRYVGLLPHTARDAELVIGSTRGGDSVAVDAGGCDGLVSRDFNVTRGRGERMWRASYGLRAQRRPCWLRVHVFTSAEAQQGGGADGADDGSAIPDALQPQAAAEDEGRKGAAAPPQDAGRAALQQVEKEGVRRVLYRSYSIRLVPLSPLTALSLRAISFSNSTATLVACGIPSRLGHLFVQPRPAAAPTAQGGAAAAGPAAQPLPAPLVAAPGLLPRVAYYLNAPAAAAAASMRRRAPLPVWAPADASQQQQQQQQQPSSPQPAQAVLSLTDPLTNQTVIWADLTAAECAPDRFVLAPLAQVLALGGEARMAPELMDASAEGVRVGMSGVALALSDGAAGANGGGAAAGGAGGGGNSSGLISAALLLQDAANISLALAGGGAAAAADGHALPGVPRLPGASLELPVITTADDGLSSKTYTLVLYTNVTSAQTLARLRTGGAAAAPGNASAPDGDAAAAARRGGAAGSGSRPEEEEAAALQRDVFGSRPAGWPASPGESSNCSLCARGTYSSKLDARECQVCPPGKFSASPFSSGCSLCPQGSFSYFWGADACRTCLPGTFAALRGSLYCDICADGRTTIGEGASGCDVSVADLATPEYVMLLSFGVLLSGASLNGVSRDTTGINASSEGIVAVLVRSDTASALNVSLEAVTIGGVTQMSRRRLLVNVSAAVPINTEDAAAADTRDLSADALIQRLIEDPNAFLRTTQTLGAESAAITDLTTSKRHNALGAGPPSLHAVLWPSLAGIALLLGSVGYTLRRWRRRRRARARGGALAPIIHAHSDDGGGSGGYEDSAHAFSAQESNSGPAVAGGGAGGDGSGRRAWRRRGWWGRLAGAVAGARGGLARGGVAGGAAALAPRLELAYISSGDAPDAEPRASPREDSFAALLRQKQQQALAAARARRSRGAGAGGGDAGDGRDACDAASTEGRGPPSDLADSATELENGRAGDGLGS